MKKFIRIISLILIYPLSAQEQTTNIDTVAIRILAPQSTAIGHQVIKIKPKNSAVFLSEALQKAAGVAVRDYGFGQLSSISVKGLSASQNLFLWEGIPLNSSLNGQVDANIISPYTTNTMTYRSGAGSSHFGSGALGGVFSMDYQPLWQPHTQITMNQGIGSFGLSRHGIQVEHGNQQWSISAGTHYLRSNNEFDFEDTWGKKYRTEDAGFDIVDLYLNTAYALNAKHQLTFNLWNQWADRNVGATEARPKAEQRQYDQNQRYQLSWLYRHQAFKHQLQSAYTSEFFDFRLSPQSPQSISFAENYFLNYYAEWQRQNFGLKAGLQSRLTTGGGDNLSTEPLRELHSFLNYQQRLGALSISANLRGSFSSKFTIPLTYDVGAQWHFNPKWSARASYATSYRTPTFNDLYWKQGGNPQLKPEQGKMGEIGIVANLAKAFQLDLSAYYGEVKDWILWYPNALGFWTPTNLDFVTTQGGTLRSLHSFQWGAMKINFSNTVAYTDTHNQRTGHPLLYTPKWNYNNSLSLKRKHLALEVTHFYTSKRSTDNNGSYFLPAYHLWNTNLSHTAALGRMRYTLSLSVKNLLNQHYNTMQGYPMPGRQYLLNLTTIF
ncbi:TonB-dependent receptor [Riemerella columbina]|uniref:TonB-dependent receptor n=1 Tax=Riemerella columbina TaxID=103810 RepID=UPI00266EBC19|nr:TonB-dependent receptor [Riemerella columbina]WKS94730.1 TonB-dependent receptor [Riemerella columbina]